MKNKIIFISLLLILIGGCSNNNEISNEIKLPLINEHNIKNVPYYYLDGDEFYLDHYQQTNLHFFNGNKVPYYNVVEYFSNNIDFNSYDDYYATYSYETTKNKIKIINEYQNEYAIIDFDYQTITYSNYFAFTSSSKASTFSSNLIQEYEQYYFVGNSNYNFNAPKEYIIKLSDYNIPIYFEAGQGYLPYYLFRNIFQYIPFFLEYYNGNYIYNFSNRNDSPATLNYFQKINQESDQYYIKSKDILEFNYNLLALTIDHVFGLEERVSRIDGHVIKYNEHGAYEILKPYKDRLMSTEPNVSNDAMYDLFYNELNDGGHSAYYSLNIFSTESKRKDSIGELGHTKEVYRRLKNERELAKYSPCDILNCDPNSPFDAYYHEIDDVAFVTFDSFVSISDVMSSSDIDETNYFYNTMSLIHYANRMIQEHDIKNVVLDISCNTGGSISSALFVASWFSNGVVTFKEYNSKSNSFIEGTVHGDINLNNSFDEGDYLGPSINKYCIVSNASFSAAHRLACLLEDNSTTKFIGEETGGGSCVVGTNYYTALGGTMDLSIGSKIVRKNSTLDNIIDGENSVVPNFYSISSSLQSAKEFFNRDEIVKKIHDDNK